MYNELVKQLQRFSLTKTVLNSISMGLVSVAGTAAMGILDPGNIALLQMIMKSFGFIAGPMLKLPLKVALVIGVVFELLTITWAIFGPMNNTLVFITGLIVLGSIGGMSLGAIGNRNRILYTKWDSVKHITKFQSMTMQVGASLGLIMIPIGSLLVKHIGWRLTYMTPALVELIGIVISIKIYNKIKEFDE